MKSYLYLSLGLLLLSTAPISAQTAKRTTTTKRATANGYHHTTNTKAKARAGAYSRYDRSGRRNEEDMKLAPGMRLNMPSPPTTDYMGRPLKKKTPAPVATGASSLEPGSSTKKTTAPIRKR